ncbi:MAG: hypothetical protein ABR924_16550, partial [Terracidiphilus sp.]
MPKTAVGEVSRIKIEAEPVPEYRIVELPVSKFLGTDIAGKSIVQAIIVNVSYQTCGQQLFPRLRLRIWRQTLNDRL